MKVPVSVIRFLFGRQQQAVAAEPGADDTFAPSHVTPLEPEHPADEHPPTPAPEPEPPAPDPAPPAPDPQPPTPEPGPPTPQLRPVPVPALEPEPELAEEQEPVVSRLPLKGAEPREWNVWELERLARDEVRDPRRDEELAFLLLELRQFANADGQLPVSFDPVVRESFGELLYAAV